MRVWQHYQPTALGALLTACNTTLPTKSIRAAGGPKMATGVWKGVYPQVFGRSRHLSVNEHSMRKVCRRRDAGENRGGRTTWTPTDWNADRLCKKRLNRLGEASLKNWGKLLNRLDTSRHAKSLFSSATRCLNLNDFHKTSNKRLTI